MRYLALAADYDGTVASDGNMSEKVLDALERLKTSGRRSILVTGRRLDDFLSVCPHTAVFDRIVAENGALVYDPVRREEKLLGNPPSKLLVKELQARGVPFELGEVIVASYAAYRRAIQDALWNLGLESQLIANRDAVMILPSGINKATGLQHALRDLGLSRHEAVGIGDSENDHSLLSFCACPVAVANAVPAIKSIASHMTEGENGSGMVELIDQLIADDLRCLEPVLQQHAIPIGKRKDGAAVCLPPYGTNMLIAGPSGSGKSTFATGIVERLIERDYQVCIVDPEGDYGTLPGIVVVGNQLRAPSIGEALSLLEDPGINLSINLLGLPLEDRPEFFASMIPNLQAMRARVGRPHWIVLDEAHHMLPDTWGHAASTLPQKLRETILITVHPDHVTPEVLSPVEIVMAVGRSPEDTVGRFGRAAKRTLIWPDGLRYEKDHVIAWFIGGEPPFSFAPFPGRAERIRHRRKYAEGNLRTRSFYFRGPECRHNIKAQNLAIFCQIAEGIDEETWMFHLRRGDYSRWLRDVIRDLHLAEEVAQMEHRMDLAPQESRRRIVDRIGLRYTLGA